MSALASARPEDDARGAIVTTIDGEASNVRETTPGETPAQTQARAALPAPVGTFSLAGASFEAMQRVGSALARCGYYKDVTDVAQACAKLLVGQELGLTLYETMTGIRFVEGKIEMAPALMAARINRAVGYGYKVEWITNPAVVDEDGDPLVTGCRIRYTRDNEELGVSKFTHADAVRARLAAKDNYQKYARNMYYARAMSNGVKWYLSEIFGGGAVYAQNEIVGTDFSGAVLANEDATENAPIAMPAPSDEPIVLADETRAAIAAIGWLPRRVAAELTQAEHDEAALRAKIADLLAKKNRRTTSAATKAEAERPAEGTPTVAGPSAAEAPADAGDEATKDEPQPEERDR